MKKGQIENPVVIFIGLMIMAIIFAPIILKIFNSSIVPIAETLGNMTPQAETNMLSIRTSVINMWDWVIICFFLINIILLYISAFMIDTHPIFLVMYILFGFLIFVFLPHITASVDAIYGSAEFVTEAAQLPMVEFIRSYFGLIILAVFFTSGVVLFGKVMFRRMA